MTTRRPEGLDLSDPRWIDQPEMLVERLLAPDGQQITLDCSGPGPFPTAILQILLSAVGTARAHGAGISLAEPSAAFREALDLLGLRAELIGD